MLFFLRLFSFLTNQKIKLSSNCGQNIFEDLSASRTAKCSLEDVLEAQDVLKDFTSVYNFNFQKLFLNKFDSNL